MGNNLKTFEEYKYFKIGSSRKDPNEPFFNKDKPEYKNKTKILSLFNLTVQEWDAFLDRLKNIPGFVSDDCRIYNEGGGYGYKTDSNYYWLYYTKSEDSIMYLLPNHKIVVIERGKKRKKFAYQNKPNLDEIFNYIHDLKIEEIDKSRISREKYEEEKLKKLTKGAKKVKNILPKK